MLLLSNLVENCYKLNTYFLTIVFEERKKIQKETKGYMFSICYLECKNGDIIRYLLCVIIPVSRPFYS